MQDALEQAKQHFQESLVALEEGDYMKAEDHLRLANALVPNRPSILTNLSAVLVHQQKWSEATLVCTELLKLEPTNAEGLINLGICQIHTNKRDEALDNFHRATDIAPLSSSAWTNKGNALLDLEELEKAQKCLKTALDLNPNSEEALVGLGNLYNEQKNYSAGLECFSKVIEINPNNSQAKWNKALSLLRLGLFEEGWKLYESRWQIHGMQEHAKYQQIPLWLGSPSLQGKTVLIHAEQGFGDAIQMGRYLPMIENEMGAKVVFEVPRALTQLMRSLSSSITVIESDKQIEEQYQGTIDFQCPVMSLPLAFKTSINTIPNTTPYLFAQPEKIATWNKRLNDSQTHSGAPKIGIAWSGSGHYAGKLSAKRDLPIAELLVLLAGLKERGIEAHSLQVNLEATQKTTLTNNSNLLFHESELHDFADTAGLISQLDLVISVDTAVAHLAGALNKPLLLMLPDPPDFMSLQSGDASPWYPSATLIRQDNRGNWKDSITKVLKLLDQKLL